MTQYNIHLQNNYIIFHDGMIILNADGTILKELDISLFSNELSHTHPIGNHNRGIIYCAEWMVDKCIPDAFIKLPIKRALEHLKSDWYPVIARAIAIVQWDKNNRFCGYCGSETITISTHFEKKCPECHLLFYPRISPSIIVLIEKGDHLLMARSPHFLPGVFGLIAGFVEAGESLEEAVHREVKEEVGLLVKKLRYISSQSWPFPDSLIAGFRAQYDSGELLIDQTELESAGWYRYDNLPGYPSTSVSIARKLIDQFVAEKMNPH